jgi:transcription antitermination factor NusG
LAACQWTARGVLGQGRLGLRGKRVARNRSRKVPGWFVARTRVRHELEAKKELRKQGYDATYPLMRMPLTPDGVRKVVPVFDGYVFVRQCLTWWSIRGTRGIVQLMMNCERPAVLADDTLQIFLSGSVDNLGYYIDPLIKLFHVGEYAAPRFGTMAGSRGLISQLSGDGRCELLYMLMGREVRVQTRVTALA